MATPVLRCQSCRLSVLEAFTSLAGIRLPSRHQIAFRTRPVLSASQTFCTSARRFQSLDSPRATQDGEHTPDDADQSSSTAASVPWYLAIDNPLPPLPTAPSPLLARQEIPPLPPSPPAVLDPLLQHLSISIGLDNLTLLDLRTLQPPPALGANLIMIIGTARSVKHLNVSADRFCRWLRSKYKLRPYADGLLGRNELKIKLRRKARRIKLARTAGRLDAEDMGKDDGITTGWVCVNIGPVDDVVMPSTPESEEVATEPTRQSSLERENEDDDNNDEALDEEEDEYHNPDTDLDLDVDAETNTLNDGYIGFGSRHTSQRIVVQMFTEEKRLEVNLEDLYANRNTRMQKRDAQIDEQLAAREAKEAELATKRAEKEAKARAKQEKEGKVKAEEEARMAQAGILGDEEMWKVENEVGGEGMDMGEEKGGEECKVDGKGKGKGRAGDDDKWSPLFRDL